MQSIISSPWPSLPLQDWEDTYQTLHLWTQIIGKIRLEYTPWTNHSWHTPLYLTSSGLTTSLIPHTKMAFEINFDFISHSLNISTESGDRRSFPLSPMSVATFYGKVMRVFNDLGIEIKIYAQPVEMPDPVIPFADDETHASYNREAVERFWKALVKMNRVFTAFRARFIGKVSPVHFFWGAFDLAVSRFSGNAAPPHPGGVPNCADWVMQEAYSHEVSSAGFWPGSGLGEPAFYSYVYPEPEGFRTWENIPEEAYFLESMGEYILSYEVMRKADNPDKLLLDFFQSTYEAAAELGNWDRKNLEKSLPPK